VKSSHAKRVRLLFSNHALRLITLLSLLLLAGSFRAFAQEATMLGTVTDPSGAAVPSVSVTITNVDTGTVTHSTTNDVGQYVAPGLPIGRYTVQAKSGNFKLAEQKNIGLQVGDRRRVDFELQLGNTQESITVEASAVQVQADSGEISDVINGRQVTSLATNGRSVAELEALVPGASSAQGDFQVPTSAGGDFNVSFNGQRVVHNLWLVDGGEAADRGGGGGADVLPSLDAIAEFRTLTSNYSAEYGLSSAGTMSMVIKSGTRQLHASAFYYGRNDAFDARNYFNPAPAKVQELRFNDWGFNVGGPVAFKHTENPKTFFFYNMEWRRYVKGGLFNVNTPLASMYPDASGPGTGVVLPTVGPDGKTAISAVAPSNIGSLWTAGGCSGAAPAVGSALPAIPACLVDPNAAALLGAGIFPKPTSGWAFIGGANQPTTGKEEIVRIDHTFTDKFSVFGHFIADQALQTYGTTQWSGDNVPSIGNTFGNPSRSYVIHATNVIRPNLLNEVAFSYDGNRIHILPQGVFKAPSGFTFNRIFTGTNVDNRIPDINLSQTVGSNYTVNWLPWNNTADDYQVRDDLSWTKGAHQFKFGAGWAIYKKVQDYFAETQGGFKFDGSATGFDYADFILGDAQHYAENAYKGTGYWNAISPHAYFQDNWRATRRLTLNLGLRWDGIPHTYEANGNQTNFYPNLYNPANAAQFVPNSGDGAICGGTPLPAGCSAQSPGLGTSPIASLQGYQFYLNGMGFSGKNGVPKGLGKDAWWNFGPRLGFAYDLFGTGKTIVRGGYGLMYERIQGNDMYNGATNPPFGYSLGASNVLLSDPHVQWGGGTVTVPIVPASVTGINGHYPSPSASQYSAGVQQQIAGNAVLSVSYVGSVDRHQSYWQELNLPAISQLTSLQNNGVGTDGVTAFNGLVPFQGYTSIKQAFNGGNSHYNSLQAELRGKVTRDLQLQAAYTLSRSIDPTTGNGGNGFDLNYVTNPYLGWKYDVGPSVFDRTHVALINFIYDIPIARNSSSHLMKTVVGGWQLSGIVTMESGTPYNLAVNSGTVASIFPGGDVANRPNLTGSISYPKTPVVDPKSFQVTGIQWVNAAAFQAPAPGTWGNLGFDALRGPGRDDWNLSLFKSFVISESRGSRFEFRADAFNAWNHTQFGGGGQNGGFSNNLTAGNFGQITSAFDAREFQLGAKLIF
jgi:hypothetical protein